MPVHCDLSGDVAVITIENPPVNALSAEIRAGILDAVNRVDRAEGIAAAVMIGAGRAFIAGADIREFGKPHRPPDLNACIAAIETCSRPVVAAIAGVALGGGLEVALGCHYRVALAGASLGLPEVRLGLLPGAGGTQRLPRLVGVERAAAMVTSGEPVNAAEAASLGMVDAVFETDLLENARAFARERAAAGSPHPVIRAMPVPQPPDPGFFDGFRERLERRGRGQESPLRGLESVQNAVELSFEDGLARERRIFEELRAGEQSRGMIHAFFAERAAARIPGLPRETAMREVARAAVIGCGTMGGGIAMVLANAGLPVTVVERDGEALERGMAVVRRNYAGSVSRGRISQAAAEACLARMTTATDLAAVADADLVIEAVFEEMAVKQEMFRALDRVCRPGAILATNTSTLDINVIAAETDRPGDVIGMHFFSPANVMRLLEVIRHDSTSDEVIATAMRLARRLGKVAVLVGVCDGFVGNRILHAYGRQASYMIEDGAMPWDVDRVMTRMGMPMGIFAMGDLAGLDVGWRVRRRQAATRPNHLRYVDLADRVCELGRFGQKTGKGWYRYEDGSRRPIPDPEIERLILDACAERGIRRRAIPDEEIHKRIFYQMANEGAKILDEGLAIRASDIDVIYVHGYGFPPWRGGPMFQAEQVGLAEVLADIEAFQAQDGQGWEPAPLLRRLVAEGKGFTDYDREAGNG